jgi:hypothetical protein
MIALDRLQQIIPPDQALANKALQVALQQITNIDQLSLPTLAVSASTVETTKDLPLVSALTQAVPASVADYFIDTLSDGTGENNTLLIVDFLGTAAGWIHTDVLVQTVELFGEMNLTYLGNIYSTMNSAASGAFDVPNPMPPPDFDTVIPSGYPAAGTYGSRDSAVQALISVAQTEIGNLIATYPVQTSTMNIGWTSMANQITLEQTQLARAQIVFANLPANDKSSIYGLIFNLPSLGLGTQVGGTAQFIEDVADLSTFTGQAVVACLREGRNQQALSGTGILTSSNIPAEENPPPPQATLIPSTYTEAEATALVIK